MINIKKNKLFMYLIKICDNILKKYYIIFEIFGKRIIFFFSLTLTNSLSQNFTTMGAASGKEDAKEVLQSVGTVYSILVIIASVLIVVFFIYFHH